MSERQRRKVLRYQVCFANETDVTLFKDSDSDEYHITSQKEGESGVLWAL